MKHVDPDGEIVSLFCAQKEEAIALVEEKYGSYLLTVARNILHDEEDSRETLNDALFAAWRQIPKERPRCLRAYLARVVRNAALNRRKASQRDRRVPDDAVVDLEELIDYLVDPESVEKVCDDRRLKALIDRFVRDLTDRRRYIFVARYYYCDSIADIARALDISEALVYKELAKIKILLKTELGKEGF